MADRAIPHTQPAASDSDGLGSGSTQASRQRASAVALVAVGSIVGSAFIPSIRFVVLAALLVALLAAWRYRVLLWPVAAVLPAALNLAWGTLPQPVALPGNLYWCSDLLSPVALWRAGEAIGVFVLVGLLLRRLRVRAAEIGLVRPTRPLLAVSLGAAVCVALGSLVLGTVLAKPFFGTIQLQLSDPASILPALVLAIANGSMEEVAYRGAMLHWLTPSLGFRGALIAQAICFGAAHTGSDFTGSPLPVMLAVAGGGLIAGLIVRRTGTLTFPISVHAAFDFPLYYVAACRLA
jgi:membrane protease YdiL (CAAX protease family)